MLVGDVREQPVLNDALDAAVAHCDSGSSQIPVFVSLIFCSSFKLCKELIRGLFIKPKQIMLEHHCEVVQFDHIDTMKKILYYYVLS